jgi:hypothetical protein
VVTRLSDLRAIKVVEVFIKVVRSLLESQDYLSNLSIANTLRDLSSFIRYVKVFRVEER